MQKDGRVDHHLLPKYHQPSSTSFRYLRKIGQCHTDLASQILEVVSVSLNTYRQRIVANPGVQSHVRTHRIWRLQGPSENQTL